MKIFFTGSIADHRPGTGQSPKDSDQPLLSAAVDLGHETANRGHTILLRNAGSPNLVDRYVLQGAADYCSEHGSTVSVQLHVPETYPLNADFGRPGIEVQVFRHPGHGTLSSHIYSGTYFEFLATNVRAVDLCDVVIALGDGESVRMAGALTAFGKTRILSIPLFGGSAAEVYEQNRNVYANMLPDSSLLSSLIDTWNPTSPKKIMRIAERLAMEYSCPNHTYFISYSHHDASIADHVELFLRRLGRRVLRDEESLQVGSEIPRTLAALIAECETFLIIGSQNYNKSEWCGRELSFAIKQTRHRRIVYMDTDGTEYPFLLSDRLVVKTTSRETHKYAIDRIVSEELSVAANKAMQPSGRASDD